MKKIFKQISALLVLTLLIQLVFPLSSLANTTDKNDTIYQENPNTNDLQYKLENHELLLENNNQELITEDTLILQPQIWSFLLRVLIKDAIEEKMRKEIKNVSEKK